MMTCFFLPRMYQVLLFLVALFTPASVGAQTFNAGYLQGGLGQAQDILNQLIPFIITLAVIFFFWGMIKFILNAGDPEGRKSGLHTMVWGIIALFVIVGVWGLVDLLSQVTGVETGGTIDIPTVAPTGP